MKKAIYRAKYKVDDGKLKISKKEQMKVINLLTHGSVDVNGVESLIKIISEKTMSYVFVNYCIENEIGLNYLSHLDLQDDLLIKIKNKKRFQESEQTLLYRYYSKDNHPYYSTKKTSDEIYKKRLESFDLSQDVIVWGLKNLQASSNTRFEYLKSLKK